MKSAKIPQLLILSATLLAGCGPTTSENPQTGVHFNYSEQAFTPIIGSKTNDEVYDYDSIIVNPVDNLREDFAMGVDASMVKTVEENGGVYYNHLGQEQDVFQILADHGVNFFRVRIWNAPYNLLDDVFLLENYSTEIFDFGAHQIDTLFDNNYAKGYIAFFYVN